MKIINRKVRTLVFEHGFRVFMNPEKTCDKLITDSVPVNIIRRYDHIRIPAKGVCIYLNLIITVIL